MRRALALIALVVLSACGEDPEPAQPKSSPHLIRQLQNDERDIRAVDTCDAVRAIPDIEERAAELVGQEVSFYEDYYGESEYDASASCDLSIDRGYERGLSFHVHQESDTAVGYERWPVEIFDGCFLDPETIGTSVVGVACTSSLELSMWVSDENRSDGLCDEGAEDECRTLMREFLTAVDEQDPDQNLAPEDEGRPEEIAAMGLGKNLLYRHDVCKAITSAGLEDDLAEQLGVAADDLTIYSTVYGHPRDEEVQGCDFYFEFDPAEDGAEHPLSLELAFSRSPVEPIVGDDVFPGCLLDGLRVVCGDHLVLRLVGGYVDDATDRIDDFPGLAHDVLVTLSKQGEI